MTFTFNKTNPDYSTSYRLIDANSCIGDSLSTINANFNNLLTPLSTMFTTLDVVDTGAISNFYNLTSFMLTTMYRIKTINEVYIKPYTTIKALSSQWSYKEFSLYYPTIVDFSFFNSDQNFYKSNILSWLNNFFPAYNFPENQILNVFITLNYSNDFSFNFSGNLKENCAPLAQSDNTVSCDGCGGDTRHGGCNHDANGRHWCDNAYIYCAPPKKISDTEVFTCNGSVGDTYKFDNTKNPTSIYDNKSGNLSINYSLNASDKITARIVRFKLQNVYTSPDYNWTYTNN